MLQLRGDPDLLQETIGPKPRGYVLEQHFDRDLPVVPQIPSGIDGRHPTTPDLVGKLVLAGQRLVQPIDLHAYAPRPIRYAMPTSTANRAVSAEATSRP